MIFSQLRCSRFLGRVRNIRESVSLKCSRCNRSFRVLEDEQFDHDCPYCGPIQDESEGTDALGDEIRTGDNILEYNGEKILESNVIDYLVDYLGAIRKVAGE